MVSPIFGGILSGGSIRNWLRTDGAGIFKAFDSGAEALRYVRSNLGAIRTQDFYQIRKEVLSIATSWDQLEGYPGNQLVPRAWHITNHGLNLSSDFQYRIEIFGSDPNTGQLKSQVMTIATDHQLTQHEVQDVARSYIGEGGESGEIVLDRFGRVEPLMRS